MQIWNPWHGCRKYSEGCEHCYMYYLDARRDRDGSEIYRTKTNFDLPLKKTRQGSYKIRSGTLLHVCMTSDFFLEEADEWREEVWDMIRKRSDVMFWIQTKRAERIEENLPHDWRNGWDNVILCVTTENQTRADERLPILLDIPAKHKAFMIAPILSEVHAEQYLASGQFEKVLADGENYDGTRPCRYEWIKSLHDQCENADVEFDFVGTGNIFIKDGKAYRIPKAYQRVQARRSGLSYPPENTDIPMQPKCRFCKRKNSCNGCHWCGKCGTL
ncbi:MAG: phage Gp37/Gp68 family protein [Clostridium sp.]|nr:phage Gp37/Gp68 family protein [Clostridium sp.]